MKKPEAVLFDLGNVLVSIHPERFLGTLGIDRTEGRQKYQSAIIDLVSHYERGDTTTDEFMSRLSTLFDGKFPREKLIHALKSVIGDGIPGMETLVKRIARRITVALVSNTNELHFNHCLETLPVLGVIRRYFLSYQLKSAKPDPSYYSKVIQKLSADPSDIIFIDDLSENTEGAEAAGMNAILFSSPSALESVLRKYKLL